MTEQTPESRINQLEQTVAYLGRTQAQTDEILLLLARRSAEHEQAMQEISDTLNRTAQRQEANAVQIAANTEGLAELRTILRERYNGNGQASE